MKSYNMYVPTRTLFGVGMLNWLHEQTLPGKRALVVISNGKSTIDNGYLKRTEEQLKIAGVETVLFNRVEPNPLRSTVMEGARVAKENGCDFLVALGGGSVMDAAKGIAVMATNDGDLWDYMQAGSGGKKEILSKPLPIVAITTTAGTGSETDAVGVITHETRREKMGLVHPSLFPVLAIVDPELTVSVPPFYTACQGFDALFHSIEGYVSNGANPISDMYALTAIEHIARYLPRAVMNGSDLEAREHISFGNTLSGSVMCVGRTTSQHSLEHAMSAYHQDLPHGAGLIMISRAYFSHLIEYHVCDGRFVRLAQAMGKTEATSPEEFIDVLDELQKACGVSNLKMSDYGIQPEEFQLF